MRPQIGAERGRFDALRTVTANHEFFLLLREVVKLYSRFHGHGDKPASARQQSSKAPPLSFAYLSIQNFAPKGKHKIN